MTNAPLTVRLRLGPLLAREERALGRSATDARRWVEGFERAGMSVRPTLFFGTAATLPGPDVRTLVDPLGGTVLANDPVEGRGATAVAGAVADEVPDTDSPFGRHGDAVGRGNGRSDRLPFAGAIDDRRRAFRTSGRPRENSAGDGDVVERAFDGRLRSGRAGNPMGSGSGSNGSDRQMSPRPAGVSGDEGGASSIQSASERSQDASRRGDGRDPAAGGHSVTERERPLARPLERRELRTVVGRGTSPHKNPRPGPPDRRRATSESHGAPAPPLAPTDPTLRTAAIQYTDAARLAEIVDRLLPTMPWAPWWGTGPATRERASFTAAPDRSRERAATEDDHGARIAHLLERAVRRLDAIEDRLAGARDGHVAPNAGQGPGPEVAWLEDDDLADRLHRILRGQALRRGIDLS